MVTNGFPVVYFYYLIYWFFFAVSEKVEPPERGQIERGHQRERDFVLCIRTHEGESLPASQGTLRTRV